ncbi:MAG TPA: hypothetical protein V6D10_03465 [Trichocoleus sp.]
MDRVRLRIDLNGSPEHILAALEDVTYLLKRDLDESETLEYSINPHSNIEGRAEIILPEARKTPRSLIWDIAHDLFYDQGISQEEILEQAVPILIQQAEEELGIKLTQEQAAWYMEEAVDPSRITYLCSDVIDAMLGASEQED